MILGSLLLFTILSGAAGQDCSTQIQRCMNIYMDNIALHPNNGALICQDTNVFLKCIRDDCGLSEHQTVEIMAAAQRDLASKGFHCVVNLNNLSTLRPQTMNPPTAEPTTCDAAVTSCTRAYLNDVISHANTDMGNQQICQLIESYVTCLVRSPCETRLIRSKIKDNIESELEKRQIHCKLNIGEKLVSGRPQTLTSRTVQPTTAPRRLVTTTSLNNGKSATTLGNTILSASLTTVNTLIITAFLRNF